MPTTSEVDLEATHRIAKAQLGLLKSLAAPRISHADPYLGYRKKKKAGSSSGTTTTTGTGTSAVTAASSCTASSSIYHSSSISATASTLVPETHDDYQASLVEDQDDYHTSKVSAKDQERQREVLEVAALHHQAIPLPQRPNEKIVANALRKREEHEQAIKSYEARIREITDNLEEQVLAVSRGVKEALEEVDSEISKKFKKLGNDDYLVTIDIRDVQQTWKSVEEVLDKRSQEVSKFASQLDGIEQERLKIVSEETRKLVDYLVKINHKFPADIERLAEVYSCELNMVMVSNRESHAEVVSILEKLDVVERDKGNKALEERQRAWSRLKHELAIRVFQKELASDKYTNPSDRQTLLEKASQAQIQRHERRMQLLSDLRKQVYPTISSNAIADIHGKLESLDEEEQLSSTKLLQDMNISKEASNKQAEERREALRAELHTYGHLHAEPDLKSIGASLESSLAVPDLDELLTRSGDLKGELKTIIKDLKDPRAIYPEVVAEAISKVDLLLASEHMDDILTKEGNSKSVTLKKAFQDTLETLRTALKSEVLPIWTNLEQQVAELLEIKGLSPVLVSTFQEITPLFAKAQELATAPSSPVKASASPARSARTPTSRTPRTNRGFFDTGPDIDMNIVRSVQKRLALVVNVPSLPMTSRQLLHRAAEALEQQQQCNALIDEVVSQESQAPLAQRQEEQATLIGKVQRALSMHIKYLQVVQDRLCDFYTKLAIVVEQSRVDQRSIDKTSEDDMENKKGTFQREDRAREDEVAKRLDRVRHAADNNELETSFVQALALLAEVERSYRNYHKEACDLAGQHPVAVKDQAITYRYLVCDLLGLISPLGPPPKKEPVSTLVEGEQGQEPAEPTPQTQPESHLLKQPPSDLDPLSLPTYSISTLATYPILKNPHVIASILLEDLPEPEPDSTALSPTPAEAPPEKEADPVITFTPLILQAPPPTKGAKGKAPPPPVAPKFYKPPFFPLSEGEVSKLAKEQPELLPVYLKQRRDAFIPLPDEEVAKLDAQLSNQYNQVKTEIEDIEKEKAKAVAEEAARKEAERKEKGQVPRDKDGRRCMEKPMVPVDVVATMVSCLRDTILKAAEEEMVAREGMAQAVYTKRTFFLTEELEERLRMHWPRKGRSEVSCKQPREGELIVHCNKAERHVRILADRNVAQEKVFQGLVQESLSHVKAFEDALTRFEEMLPSQTSLAGFQGVDMRCKKDMALFRPQCEEDLTRLEAMVTTEPTKLLNSNSELLRTCKSFQEGGDYDQKEVDLLKIKLERPTEAVKASIEARKVVIAEVKEAQDKAWGKTKEYKEKHEAAVLDLCLREGLGQKYGAPRRVAQERCRTEICRDDKNAQQLGTLLSSLEELCRKAAAQAKEGIQPTSAKFGRRFSQARRMSSVTAGAEPIAVSIRKTLMAIRKCAFKRGLYLEHLKGPTTIRSDLALPLDLEEGDGVGRWPEVEVPDITVGTFSKAVEVMEEECKAATKKLYEGDGKQAALGPEGIPDSLKAWLAERKEKLLGEGGTRHKSTTGFEEAIRRLEGLLKDQSNDSIPAPAAYLDDITRRAKTISIRRRNEEQGRFDARIQAWEEQKEVHRNALRPRLGTPDAAQDLAQLQREEASRCQEVQSAVASYKKRMLQDEAQRVKQFVARINAGFKMLLSLLDTLIYLDDVGPLSQQVPEEPVKKSTAKASDEKRKSVAMPAKGDKKGAKADATPVTVEPTDPLSDWQRNAWTRSKWPPLMLSKIASSLAQSLGNQNDNSVQAWEKENTEASVGFSFSTPIHARLVQARDAAVQSYATYYEEVAGALESQCDQLLAAEKVWEQRWTGMIASMVESSGEIS